MRQRKHISIVRVLRATAGGGVLLLSLVLLPGSAFAQEASDLQIFGSLQSIFMHQESVLEAVVPVHPGHTSGTETRNTFALQQMDLFFRKEIDDAFTAFVDLEFQLNYSSDQRWGSLSLQEAWVNYHLNDAFNVKAGLLFPSFNHLNEIKNRLALQPYVFRPLVYERLLANQFYAEDFIPEHAFLQLHGFFPAGDFFLDYAAYAGNAESSYISRSTPAGGYESPTNNEFEFLSGVDPTNLKLKLIGGRFGLRTRDEQFKVGLSITHDYNNLRDSTRYPNYIVSSKSRSLLGSDAPRFRFGTDLSARYGPWTFEGEIIKVVYDFDQAKRLNLQLEQFFGYGHIGYDILPALTAYGSLQWGDYTFGVDSDYFVYMFGGAYRVNNAVTAKAQLIVYNERFDDMLNGIQYNQDLVITFVFLGFSVLL